MPPKRCEVIVEVFEDADWRAPIFGLARDGLLFVALPTLCFVLLCWGDDPLPRVWVVLLGWNLGAMLEGFRRYRAITTADSVARIEVHVDQVTSRVLQIDISASAFRRIERVSVELLSKSERLDGLPQQVDRRVLPGAGRRSVSAAVYLSVPALATGGASAGLATSLTVRLITTVTGCPDLVHDVPIPRPRVSTDRERREHN
jgi:hypothetical protein